MKKNLQLCRLHLSHAVRIVSRGRCLHRRRLVVVLHRLSLHCRRLVVVLHGWVTGLLLLHRGGAVHRRLLLKVFVVTHCRLSVRVRVSVEIDFSDGLCPDARIAPSMGDNSRNPEEDIPSQEDEPVQPREGDEGLVFATNRAVPKVEETDFPDETAAEAESTGVQASVGDPQNPNDASPNQFDTNHGCEGTFTESIDAEGNANCDHCQNWDSNGHTQPIWSWHTGTREDTCKMGCETQANKRE